MGRIVDIGIKGSASRFQPSLKFVPLSFINAIMSVFPQPSSAIERINALLESACVELWALDPQLLPSLRSDARYIESLDALGQPVVGLLGRRHMPHESIDLILRDGCTECFHAGESVDVNPPEYSQELPSPPNSSVDPRSTDQESRTDGLLVLSPNYTSQDQFATSNSTLVSQHQRSSEDFAALLLLHPERVVTLHFFDNTLKRPGPNVVLGALRAAFPDIHIYKARYNASQDFIILTPDPARLIEAQINSKATVIKGTWKQCGPTMWRMAGTVQCVFQVLTNLSNVNKKSIKELTDYLAAQYGRNGMQGGFTSLKPSTQFQSKEGYGLWFVCEGHDSEWVGHVLHTLTWPKTIGSIQRYSISFLQLSDNFSPFVDL